MDQAEIKIFVAGGGTGGHLFPALAVADELRRRRADIAIEFVGSARGLEAQVVPAAGYPLRTLPLRGMLGRGALARVGAALGACVSLARSVGWMMRERPQLTIGIGGYASGPTTLAAAMLRLPTMVMEQNHFPGATNRALARFVDAVCLPSEQARGRIGGRGVVTGNPVRAGFFEAAPHRMHRPPRLLIFGGSRGAHSLNTAMIDALPLLSACDPCPEIVHQSGPADESALREAYRRFAGNATVCRFIDEMPRQFADADLIVCRAGASTVSELCAAGRPAILVPYPHATNDHQRYNAESLVQAGAASLLPDDRLEQLGRTIAELLDDPARLTRMAQAARELARPQATTAIADVAERLLERRDVS